MAIVCANVFATVVYRVQIDYLLRKTSVKTYSSIIVTITSAIINLICSLLLSQFYYWLAKKITNLGKKKKNTQKKTVFHYLISLNVKVKYFLICNNKIITILKQIVVCSH